MDGSISDPKICGRAVNDRIPQSVENFNAAYDVIVSVMNGYVRHFQKESGY